MDGCVSASDVISHERHECLTGLEDKVKEVVTDKTK